MKNNLWIFTLQEYLKIFNIGSLWFFWGFRISEGVPWQLHCKCFKAMLRVLLFQKTTLEVLSRKYKKHQVIHAILFTLLCLLLLPQIMKLVSWKLQNQVKENRIHNRFHKWVCCHMPFTYSNDVSGMMRPYNFEIHT